MENTVGPAHNQVKGSIKQLTLDSDFERQVGIVQLSHALNIREGHKITVLEVVTLIIQQGNQAIFVLPKNC
jgi:hypothetical protein